MLRLTTETSIGPVTAFCAAIHTELCKTKLNLDCWPAELKIGTLVTPAVGNVHANFGLSMPFLFSSYAPVQDTQTDGQTRPPTGTAAQMHNSQRKQISNT